LSWKAKYWSKIAVLNTVGTQNRPFFLLFVKKSQENGDKISDDVDFISDVQENMSVLHENISDDADFISVVQENMSV